MSSERTAAYPLKTLLIAGAASAAAALVIPMLWRPGTVFAAAMTPVIVALVTEGAARGPSRPSAPCASAGRRAGRRSVEPPPRRGGRSTRSPRRSAEELAGCAGPTAPPPRAVHRRRPLSARQWKLALATGLVAFVVGRRRRHGIRAASPATRSRAAAGARRSSAAARSREHQRRRATRDRRIRAATPEEPATPATTPSADADADAHGHPDAARRRTAAADRPAPQRAPTRAGARALTPSLRWPRTGSRPRASRARRKVARLAAGQGTRQLGTQAANLTRDEKGKQAALERRHLEAAEQIVTALGTMKGAAMKLGQVLSFLDVGLVPEEYREEFQRKLGEAARRGAQGALRRHAQGDRVRARRAARRDVRELRRGAGRRRLDRPGLPRAAARRPRRRGQGPVPGRRPGRPGGHAEPRA